MFIGNGLFSIVKMSINRSLARVYAHTTGVFAFLLSQVSQSRCKPLINNNINNTLRYFPTIREKYSAESRWNNKEKHAFCSSFFKKILLSTLIFHLACDTCDSKKSTSLLEGALRVCARNFGSLLLCAFWHCLYASQLRFFITHFCKLQTAK